jgi:hypothetical protein
MRQRLVALASLTAFALSVGVAAAAVHTRASIYDPFKASGKPAVHVEKTLHGSCDSGSVAVAHRGTWRCFAKNVGFDPCFSSPKAAGFVLCPAGGPWSGSAVKIKLTKSLPSKFGHKGKPSKKGLPWALVTTAGWKCLIDTGGTSFVDGKRLNYFCLHHKDGLWGSPSRQSEPWKIFAAPPQAKKLKARVGIKAAWF